MNGVHYTKKSSAFAMLSAQKGKRSTLNIYAMKENVEDEAKEQSTLKYLNPHYNKCPHIMSKSTTFSTDISTF